MSLASPLTHGVANGKAFVGYSAFKDHYSFFPMSAEAVDAHRDELGERVIGKGTISFAYGRPLPFDSCGRS